MHNLQVLQTENLASINLNQKEGKPVWSKKIECCQSGLTSGESSNWRSAKVQAANILLR